MATTGALYYLSTWYKKDETSLRTSLFFYGQMFASATSSLISAGVLKLSGTGGLEGWRWIFLSKCDNIWIPRQQLTCISRGNHYLVHRSRVYTSCAAQGWRWPTVDFHGPLELLHRAGISNHQEPRLAG